MEVKIINPFVVAAFTFLEKANKINVSKGKLSLINSPIIGGDVNTVINLNGQVTGQIMYCMSMQTALRIASMMLFDMPVNELDELAKSAIQEMGNIITGLASSILTDSGIFCKITSPSLSMGTEIITFFKGLSTIVIPINTDYGEITIMAAIQEAS
jgi:chemotaxis protein CheX